MRRTRTQAREEAFAKDMEDFDWTELQNAMSEDEMSIKLEAVIADLTNKHFPLARVRKRSNKSPWITRRIRRLWRKKIRLYKAGGKSDRWWETDRRLQERIKESRENFVNKMLEEGNTGRSFYAATRKLSSAALTPQWSVKDIFAGKGPEGVCEEVLKYFGASLMRRRKSCKCLSTLMTPFYSTT